jgi:hypothetical protein
MADADNNKITIKDLALFVKNAQLSPAVDLVAYKIERVFRNSPI